MKSVLGEYLPCSKAYIHSLDSAKSDVLTARDNSIGNSGGTTEVRMRVHSRNSLYLLRVGFSLPKNQKKNKYLRDSANNHIL